MRQAPLVDAQNKFFTYAKTAPKALALPLGKRKKEFLGGVPQREMMSLDFRGGLA